MEHFGSCAGLVRVASEVSFSLLASNTSISTCSRYNRIEQSVQRCTTWFPPDSMWWRYPHTEYAAFFLKFRQTWQTEIFASYNIKPWKSSKVKPHHILKSIWVQTEVLIPMYQSPHFDIIYHNTWILKIFVFDVVLYMYEEDSNSKWNNWRVIISRHLHERLQFSRRMKQIAIPVYYWISPFEKCCVL